MNYEDTRITARGVAVDESIIDILAENLLDTIRATGFAIVKLPDFDSLADFQIRHNMIRQYAPSELGACREFRIDEARDLAAALLAAANKAEEDAMRISNRQRVIETTCEYLAAGNCASSVDGYCIGGTSDGQCHG